MGKSRYLSLSTLSVTVFLALVQVAAPRAGAADSTSRASGCNPPHSRTLAAGSTSRVYSKPAPSGTPPQSRPAVFGCLLATGHSRLLNATPKHQVTVFGQGVGFGFDADSVVVGEGDWVAFAETFFSIDTSVQTITTRNLRSGATGHCEVGFTNAPGRPPSVSGIVVGRDGTSVWIGTSGASSSAPGTPEVGRCEAGGEHEGTIAASGAGIRLGSLRTAGESAVWIGPHGHHSLPLHG